MDGVDRAVAVPLAGEAEVDAALLDQAVGDLNRLYAAKGLETYTAVGQYLVDVFFGGDEAVAEARSHDHRSFRALAERDDLILSKTVLHRSVQVLKLHRQLDEPDWRHVTASHYREVLALPDAGVRRQLLEAAEDEGLTSRELAERARALRGTDGKGRGRPPLPGFVKGFNRVSRAIAFAASQEVPDDAFESYSPEDATALLTEVTQGVKALDAMRARIEAIVARHRSDGDGPTPDA